METELHRLQCSTRLAIRKSDDYADGALWWLSGKAQLTPVQTVSLALLDTLVAILNLILSDVNAIYFLLYLVWVDDDDDDKDNDNDDSILSEYIWCAPASSKSSSGRVRSSR